LIADLAACYEDLVHPTTMAEVVRVYAYCVTNTVNGKKYIGITINPAERWASHRREAASRRRYALHRAMAKYSPECFTFEVIACASSWAEAQALEQLLVVQHRTLGQTGEGYNLTKGGEGVLGLRHSAEVRARIAAANKGRRHSPEVIAKLRGRRLSDEHRAKLRALAVSPEARQKISGALTGRTLPASHPFCKKGRKVSPETLEKMRAASIGKRHSAEARLKMSLQRLGRKQPESQREKASLANKTRWTERRLTMDRASHHKSRMVSTPSGVFDNAALAAESHGIAGDRARMGGGTSMKRRSPGMIDVAALAAACAPDVHSSTMAAIVRVESAGNPLALNINRLQGRQPRPTNLDEAVAAAESHIAQGRTVDLGLGQVNSANLAMLGTTVREMLADQCANLRASGKIIQACYARALRQGLAEGREALLAALSCYNTGDMRRGFTLGYVAKYVPALDQRPTVTVQVTARPAAPPAAPPAPRPPPAWGNVVNPTWGSSIPTAAGGGWLRVTAAR
jgi:type IV secretion system protein VirB1